MPPKKRTASRGTHASPARKVARGVSPPPCARQGASQGSARTKTDGSAAVLRILQAVPLTEDESLPDLGKSAGPASGRVGQAISQRHLALLAHGMVLITLTAKAQQGVVRIRRSDEGEGQQSIGSAGATPAQFLPNARADGRWLDAVTRYCNTRVTLDDLAKVSAAFPDWLSVQWSINSSRQADRILAAALCEGFDVHGDLTPRGKAPTAVGKPPAASSVSTEVAAYEVVAARIWLKVCRVPPIEEAIELIKAEESRFKKKVKRGASWQDAIARCTAYAALIRQERAKGAPAGEAFSELPSTAVAEALGELRPEASRLAAWESETPFTDEEEALLATLSAELRATLSAEKLRAVLAEMQREASGEDRIAYQRIARRHEEERVLSTYAHLRSLFGQTKTQLAAARLLETLATESRFEDRRQPVSQLALILQLDGSGMTARYYPDDLAAEPQPVTNLDEFDDDELRSVLVSLDRAMGSAEALVASLAAAQLETEL